MNPRSMATLCSITTSLGWVEKGMQSFVFAVLSTLVGGCVADAGDENAQVGGARQEIQGGRVEDGFHAVGPVDLYDDAFHPNGTCTGTLISPTLVLTAKHCASAHMKFYDVDVVEQIPHSDRDLLLLRLSSPILYAAPMGISTRLFPNHDDICTAVGYGQHTESGTTTVGVRRSCTMQVDGVLLGGDPHTIWVEGVNGIPDFGDSGGPLVCDGVIAAVASTENYNDSEVAYAALDIFWIRSHMTPPNINLLLQNVETGELQTWYLTHGGGTIIGLGSPGSLDNSWQFQGIGDFNADHQSDVLWRNTNGQVMIWFIWGGNFIGEVSPGGQDPDHVWAIQGVGDFDGDAYADILWRNVNGQLAIWFKGDINTSALVGYTPTAPQIPIDLSWQVKGVADFDGDGRADILWQHTSGPVSIWYMFGPNRRAEGNSALSDPTHYYHIQTLADFDGNGHADILWRNTNGWLSIWFDGLHNVPDGYPSYYNNPMPVDLTWQVQTASDYGDGPAELFWRHNGGQIAVWDLRGSTFLGDVYPPYVPNDWQIKGILIGDARPVVVQQVYQAVPDVIGLTFSQAKSQLEDAGFGVSETFREDSSCDYIDLVMGESPSDGSAAPYGSTIELTVGTLSTRLHCN